MKKIQIPLLFLLCFLFFTSEAIAQNKPLACQSDAASGLEWENGEWAIRRYVAQKFILVQTNEGLTKDSVAKALNVDYPDLISCKKEGTVTCFDQFGGHLLFNPKVLKGGISFLFGSISTQTRRDSVTVIVFSCTPF